MICYGEDLTKTDKLKELNLSWLQQAYAENATKNFFNAFFTKLAGTKKLREQIEQGLSEEEIKISWGKDLKKFQKVRSKYLIY